MAKYYRALIPATDPVRLPLASMNNMTNIAVPAMPEVVFLVNAGLLFSFLFFFFLHCTGCQRKLDQSEAVSTKAGVNFLCGNSFCQKAALIHSQYWVRVNSDERGCAHWLCN